MNDSTFNPFRPWIHPWRLWRALCYNVTSVPLAGIAFGFTIAFLSATIGLLITFVFALPFAWITFVLSRFFGHLERNRIASLAGVRIADPVPPLTATGWWRPPQGAGDVGAPVARDRPPPRPPARSRGHVRPDGRRVVRLAGDARCCRCSSTQMPDESGEVLLLRAVERPAAAWRRRSSDVLGLADRRAVGHDRVWTTQRGVGPGAARSVDRRRARRAGHPSRREPDRCSRQRRGRTPAHRARPARRRAATSRRLALNSAWPARTRRRPRAPR